ncbi:hypothetical protein ASPSYDRAFT_59042 [Aspergillus sydowii CBS 593.65]|uniref:tRNA (adenine(58)-N(1))-methyltransferase catalytic subunit TRM61 n=1 Tax=Aspergillus sydowii CBS 593.65 TaxID=1036612 RepID=A0A1L9TDL8_9EURO|nr:uncharacterized protein ASPSYDRAFT_59042 [Aspergillus sydowii CBS 593.65]OJJ57529.1 hypothetical protein ASPSYDRAFT_59042 [Aspergillus sydowii CBS 593.65]
MARVLRSLRQLLGLTPSSPSPSALDPRHRFARSIDTDFSYLREGDQVIVYNHKKRQPTLAGPLQKGRKAQTSKGSLAHDQIIGRKVRDTVQSSKGVNYRVTLPTLDQYVALTPRHVTPIYAKDASVIVSYLDIDVVPPGKDGDSHPPLEVLESGTGHGALTLHLSRAVQAANSLPPPIPKASQVKYLEELPTRPGDDTKSTSKSPEDGTGVGEKEVDLAQKRWDAWRAQRKAIIHTVEVSPTFSKHAEKIVRGFRRGIYAGNVDFYVGRVENWVSARKQQLKAPSSAITSFLKPKSLEPFLTHAILDMPSAHLRIPVVAPLLKPNGVLAVFMPSVTQIADCVDIIRKQRIPLDLEHVIELGTGISGGRSWDVKFVSKKSKADPGWDTSTSAETESGNATEESSGENEIVPEKAQPQEAAKDPEGVLVCRPKAGTMLAGGGFVGVWRKMQEDDTRV